MPPSKSSSKSSAPKTRRPRKKKETPAEEEPEMTPSLNDELDDVDFGDGLDDDEVEVAKPARKKAKPRKRKPKAVKPVEVDEDSDFGADLDTDSATNDAGFGDDDNSGAVESSDESRSESKNENSDENDDNKPKRRRRRRRRRNENENSSQGGGNQSGGNQGGQSNRRQGNQGGNRNHRNQGNNRSQGNQRGNNSGTRRVTKFDKNAAPLEPVATSGTIEGVLELHPKKYGFLRLPANDLGARETDTFVSSSFVEKHNLREGILIRGEIGPGTRGQGPRLLEIESIDGQSPEKFEEVSHFDTLTPINPFEQIRLETGPSPVTMRVMDLLTPIGKGQRALLVAPPRSGKTMLMQDIANSVSINHPEVHLIVLLVDERPEEVTEMRRNVKGEVIASSMDEDVESHVRISQLVFERGKRLAEAGKDCFILMDSITRTARAFNKWMRGDRNSKIATGGLDVRALDIPRKMFGTARRFDEGGSLTVCATALIDTGSRMDESIFQEFKGTGNMELVLSRDLADRRIWPALDISRSGTRREEKILEPNVLDGVTMLRRSLVSMNTTEAMDQLIRTLQKFESNSEFLEKIRSVL